MPAPRSSPRACTTRRSNDNRFVVKQKLSQISVGPLLRDAASKDLLEGRGDVVLDVTTAGTTVTALKKALPQAS